MYDPKGGDKPAYEPPAEMKPPYDKPPAEQPTYQKPPTEQPPYEKPPEEKPPEKPPCEEPTGDCKCTEWEIPNRPPGDLPFRRLLLKLETILEELSEKPTDATKKFADDLKDADKEYQGIVALVTKYKDFHDKLDCKLAEAKSWKDEIDNWLTGKLTDAEKQGIKNTRANDYDAKEDDLCCAWIKCRNYYNRMLDCLEQAKKKEEESKDDYDAIKGLEKTLSDRFTELKGLYDKAKGLRDEERFKAFYAISLEYEDVVAELGVIRDWWYARKACNGGDADPCNTGDVPTGELKKDWTPAKFKAQLICRLRLLVLAKYQRFRWQHDFLSRASENQKKKEACEKFRKERRDQFIQEADDIPESDSGGGPGNYGKPGEQPQPEPEYPGGKKPEYPQTPTPTDQYPGAQPPQNPLTEQYPGGGNEPPPPTGQYPGGQNPQYPQSPPTQQYPTGQKPEYPETPVPPTDKYQGRPKK